MTLIRPAGDYHSIAAAIDYLQTHPGARLDELAQYLNMSAGHCQKLFTQFVGISPKRFQQVLGVEHAKQYLRASQSLLTTALDSGLSGPGRLHDHFVTLEAVTPGEFKSGGQGVAIEYGVAPSRFGEVFIARSPRGLCKLSFIDAQQGLAELLAEWPKATLADNSAMAAALVADIFECVGTQQPLEPVSLWVKGSNFQVKVWQALLTIAPGTLCAYQTIAQKIGNPKAVRAVGSAVAVNPIAWLIPCHRVIRASGELGGYRWGMVRKRHMLAWEQSRCE